MIYTKFKSLHQVQVAGSVNGTDGVNPRLLKECSNNLCVPLARLFNESLAVGVIPK